MNFDKMSEKLQEIIMQAVEICKSYQHTTVDTIQMLKAIFEHDVLDGLFKRLNIDKTRALTLIDQEMNRVATSSNVNPQGGAVECRYSGNLSECCQCLDCVDV